MSQNGFDHDNIDDAYTHLEVKVAEAPIEASKENLQNFAELIEESDVLVKAARTTDHIIKDAHFLDKVAASIYESTKSINVSESAFDPTRFALAVVNLISTVGEDEDEEGINLDWGKLASKSKCIYRYAPGLTYISAEKSDQPSTQTEKVVQQRRIKEPKKALEQRKEPEKVQTITNTDEGAHAIDKINRLVKKVFDRNDKKPVCFFRFVTDPASFAKTVENIFHVAFLVKDGHVQIVLDGQGLPVLIPQDIDKPNNNNSKKANIQALVSITPLQYQRIVQEFKITEAIIPSSR